MGTTQHRPLLPSRTGTHTLRAMAPTSITARPSVRPLKRDVRVAGAGGIFGQDREIDKSIFIKPGPKYRKRWGKDSDAEKKNAKGPAVDLDFAKVVPVVAAALALFVGYE